MHRRLSTTLLATLCLCLVLLACGTEDIDDPGSGADGGTPTVTTAPAASPTSEPAATPSSPSPSTSIADLTTLDWQLAEIDDAPILDGSIVTLTLVQRDDNLITGYGDCHSYLAGIVWDDTVFRMSDSGPFAGIDASERIVCQHPDGGPEQDAAFFAALAEAVTYHASDERLALFDADGQPRLVFAPRPVVTVDPGLAGTPWLLVELNGASPLPDTDITLAFGPEGAGGNDGCNEYGSGTLVASDGRLTFVGVFQTDMACLTPEGVMEQADRYLQALAHAAGYQVDGDQLQILDHGGNAILIFVREDAASFDPALAAHRWGLIEVNGQPAIPGSLVTLELTEGFVSGSDGCNFYGSELAVASDGAIEVATPGFTQTAAGCRSPEFLTQAESVTTHLRDATWYQIDGDRLTIGDAADNRLVFGPQADVLLIGSSWSLPGLSTIEANGEIRWDGLIEGTEITLTFNEDGTLGGSTGCNTYGGNYVLDGAAITIDSFGYTMIACIDPPGIMKQEKTYISTLMAVTTWEIGMNGLTLTTDDGRALRELNVVVNP